MRRFLRVLILLAGVVLLLVASGALFLIIALSNADFAFLPQDCGGTSIHLTGTVETVSSATVFIKGEDGLYRGESPTNLVLQTDANGRFDSGDRPLHVFMCEILQVNVTAEGFETLQLRYSLLDHFSEDELLALMRAEQAIPFSLKIELQEADDA